MNSTIKNKRPFIGTKDYEASKALYRNFGFTKEPISKYLNEFSNILFTKKHISKN
jgi:hypothetical protein